MAISRTRKVRTKNLWVHVIYENVALDNDYPAGGYPIKPEDLGLREIYHVEAGMASGYAFEWDYAKNKLKVLLFDYDAVADGPAAEVPGGTDLSGVVVRVKFEGR